MNTHAYRNLRANGGVLSIPEDMLLWHQALLRDEILVCGGQVAHVCSSGVRGGEIALLDTAGRF